MSDSLPLASGDLSGDDGLGVLPEGGGEIRQVEGQLDVSGDPAIACGNALAEWVRLLIWQAVVVQTFPEPPRK